MARPATKKATTKTTKKAAKKAAPKTAPPAADPAGAAIGCIIVTGPKKGRRRAGRAFGPQPVEIALGELTGDAFDAIVNDPELHVEIIEGAK